MKHHHVFPKGHRCRIYTYDAGHIQCTHGFTDRLDLSDAPAPAREPYDASAHRVLRMAAEGKIVHERFVLKYRIRALGPLELDALCRLHNRGYLDRIHPAPASPGDIPHVIAPTDHGLVLLARFAQHHAIIPATPSLV